MTDKINTPLAQRAILNDRNSLMDRVFQLWTERVTRRLNELEENVDGGSAATVYLSSQTIDGGDANG